MVSILINVFFVPFYTININIPVFVFSNYYFIGFHLLKRLYKFCIGQKSTMNPINWNMAASTMKEIPVATHFFLHSMGSQ